MSRKNKPLPILPEVTITDISSDGRAITRHEGMVVFVPFVIPGDVVDLQITRKRHNYCEAKVLRFIEYSAGRAQPFCPHFGICGGCKWQHLPYTDQLKAKQQQIYDQFVRIGKVNIPEIQPIIGSEKTSRYRNKLEFSCSNKRWLTTEEIASGTQFDNMNAIGFHITGAFDKVFPIEDCHLMDDLNNQIRNEIRDYAIRENISFFDLREQHGLLRDIVIRNSNTGDWMVIIQFKFETDDDKKRAMRLLRHLGDTFPQISSLLYVDNQKGNDTFGDLDVHVFKGKDYILETMNELKFKVGAKSFYQTNTRQALRLYQTAKDMAQLTGKELVYDLYTGSGTIANFVADSAQKVIGIEYVPEAIENAKYNSKLNNIDNTLFHAGDMKDVLDDNFVSKHGQPDVIITDPPRAGMHPDVIKTILRMAPDRIVYVSCNPATQARDVSMLDSLYKIEAVQPVDMFPHTIHVENVVLLSKRKED